MENTKTIEKESKINLINRKKLEITGIEKVIAVNETNIGLIINGKELVITGRGMQAHKLDVEKGEISVAGEIDSMKFQHKKEKEGIFKRIFK